MSNSFKDIQNNNYNIAITMGKVKQVKESVGIDLLSVFDKPDEMDKVNDPMNMVDIIYVLCKDQIARTHSNAENVEVAFGESLDGDSLETASNAFMRALVDFFPQKKKKHLKKMLDRTEELMTQQDEKIAKKIDEAIENMTLEESPEDAKQ